MAAGRRTTASNHTSVGVGSNNMPDSVNTHIHCCDFASPSTNHQCASDKFTNMKIRSSLSSHCALGWCLFMSCLQCSTRGSSALHKGGWRSAGMHQAGSTNISRVLKCACPPRSSVIHAASTAAEEHQKNIITAAQQEHHAARNRDAQRSSSMSERTREAQASSWG